MLASTKNIWQKHKKIFLILLVVIFILTVSPLLYFFNKSFFNKSTIFKNNKIAGNTTITGFDLIDQDFKANKIDYETKLIYKVKYIYGDKSLPKNYLTKSFPFEDDGVMTEIISNYSKLSDKTKKILSPYLKRPDDPESYLYKIYFTDNSQAKVNKRSSFLDIAQAYERPTTTPGEKFNFLTTKDNKIKVWYANKEELKNFDEGAEDAIRFNTALQIVNDLDSSQAFAKFQKLLGSQPFPDNNKGGDDRLDIYILPLSKIKEMRQKNSLAVDIPEKNNTSFILIGNIQDKNKLKSVVVHELFHAFQRTYGFTGDDVWWMEATATWSENYIYPKLYNEQNFVGEFLPYPERTLNYPTGLYKYGAYVFPLYLTKTYGDVIMKNIFKNIEINMGQKYHILDAISQSIPSLSSSVNYPNSSIIRGWKDFTLWNYNLTPVDYYKKSDLGGKFPTYSSSNNVVPLDLDINKYLTAKVKKLAPLSAQVIVIDNFVDDKDVNKIEFTNVWSVKADVKQANAGVKAIIYPKSGSPYIEDWTDKFTRDFCIKKKSSHSEDISRVVLILSNAAITESFPAGSFIVQAKKKDKTCEEEKKTTQKSFTLTGSDVRSPKYGYCDWGVPKTDSNSDLSPRSFTITGEFTGKPGIIPEALEVYPYMGIWKAKYTYDGPGYAKKGSVKFDLSYAFNDIVSNYAFQQASSSAYATPIFEFKPDPYIEYHLFSGTWGSLSNITKEGATIHINLYDWDWNSDCGTAGPAFDRSDVLMYIK